MQCVPRLKQRELTFKRTTMCELAQRGVASINRDQRTGLHLVLIQKDVAHSIQRRRPPWRPARGRNRATPVHAVASVAVKTKTDMLELHDDYDLS